MHKLRYYQEEAVQKGVELLLKSKPSKGIIVAPTGAGKTHIVAEIVKRLEKPVLILQPSVEILKQNYQKFKDIGGEATIYSNSAGLKDLSLLTYATVGSIKKEALEIKKRGIKHLIIDECHLQSKRGSQIALFIKKAGITNILGLTATPIYLEGGLQGAEIKMMSKTKNSFLKDIIHVTQVQELVERNFWTKVEYKILEQDESGLEINSSGSDFKQESLERFYNDNELDKQIIDEVNLLKLEGRKSILVFVPTIAAAEDLKTKIIGSEVVHSELPKKDRDRIIEQFKNLETQVVLNVSVLSFGFDHPQLDGLILARSTMSIALYYQILGRVVRIHNEKKNAKVVDISNSFKRFGKIEDLNYEFIDGFGWGLFSKDTLLTNYPLNAEKRPTKSSIIAKLKRDKEEVQKDTYINFGKYKGKLVEYVVKKDKSYLAWLISQDWFPIKYPMLSKIIEEELGL